MLLCWIRTKSAIAAANIATPIVSPHAVAAASWVLPAASSPTPTRTKTSWVAEPTVMSTTMLAVACAPETPR